MASPSLATPYLPHLNGLRAIAILGVLLYHLEETCCPAGYFGVDLFLVLSGFLLLSNLLAPGREQHFHYGHFLLKKAWRILPSWLVVTVGTVFFSLLLMHPAQLATTMLTAASGAVFAANAAVDHSGDYFNPLSQQNPLLHSWYLSLTQQFYLVAPLLVIPLTRSFSRRAAIILLASLALLSLGFHILATMPTPLAESLLRSIGARSAYYHLIPRFWELAAGAGVLLLPELPDCPRLRTLLASAGLVGLTASFYLYDTGSSAVYLTVASAMLAVRYAHAGPTARLLLLRPLQALGGVSFSLYLWHWPVMVFWKYCCFDTPSLLDYVGMIALSLLLASLAHRLVENRRAPLAAGRKTTLRHTALLLSLPIVGFCCLLLNGRAREFASRQPLGQVTLIQHPEVETDADLLRGLESLPDHGLCGKPLRTGSAEAEPRFLLLGDSHAQHLYDALHAACQSAGLRGLYLNNTVAPYHGLIQPQVGADTCRWDAAIEQLLLDYLAAHPGITHVLIAQCWQMRMAEGAATEAATGNSLRTASERQAVTGPGIGIFCDRIRQLGRQPVLLGETPRFPRPCPLEEWHRRELLGVPQRERRMSLEAFEHRHAFPLATLRQLAQQGRALHLELADALRVENAYPASVDGTFWYYDANHLTPVAAQRVVQLIMASLQAVLPSQ